MRRNSTLIHKVVGGPNSSKNCVQSTKEVTGNASSYINVVSLHGASGFHLTSESVTLPRSAVLKTLRKETRDKPRIVE